MLFQLPNCSEVNARPVRAQPDPLQPEARHIPSSYAEGAVKMVSKYVSKKVEPG
jgi:hypothetical protein